MRLAVTAPTALLLLLCSCERNSVGKTDGSVASTQRVRVIETAWTDAAAKQAEELSSKLLKEGKAGFRLPQLRVYDTNQQLVYTLSEKWMPDTIGTQIARA